MVNALGKALLDDEAQDIAEYAVMLAVILVLVVGTIRLVGSNANNVFSSVASSCLALLQLLQLREREFPVSVERVPDSACHLPDVFVYADAHGF